MEAHLPHHPFAATGVAPVAAARRHGGGALFDGLRRTAIRRLLVVLVLCAFVPVVSATVACQVHCATDAHAGHAATAGAATAGSGHDASHAADGNADELPPLMQYLSHAGPCHMAAVPGVAALQPEAAPAPAGQSWTTGMAERYDSFICPPPEHRPRA